MAQKELICTGIGVNKKTGKPIEFKLYKSLTKKACRKFRENVRVVQLFAELKPWGEPIKDADGNVSVPFNEHPEMTLLRKGLIR
jgi:hypothetical protein